MAINIIISKQDGTLIDSLNCNKEKVLLKTDKKYIDSNLIVSMECDYWNGETTTLPLKIYSNVNKTSCLGEFQYSDGMTWRDFVNSYFNVGGTITIKNNTVLYDGGLISGGNQYETGTQVYPNDKILCSIVYSCYRE